MAVTGMQPYENKIPDALILAAQLTNLESQSKALMSFFERIVEQSIGKFFAYSLDMEFLIFVFYDVPGAMTKIMEVVESIISISNQSGYFCRLGLTQGEIIANSRSKSFDGTPILQAKELLLSSMKANSVTIENSFLPKYEQYFLRFGFSKIIRQTTYLNSFFQDFNPIMFVKNEEELSKAVGQIKSFSFSAQDSKREKIGKKSASCDIETLPLIQSLAPTPVAPTPVELKPLKCEIRDLSIAHSRYQKKRVFTKELTPKARAAYLEITQKFHLP
jgi:hypothetical protein